MLQKNHLYLACALITNEFNEMLIVKKLKTNVFIMPGGKIEQQETPTQALKREIAEELNLQIDVSKMHFLSKHTAIAANEKNTLVTACVYHIKISKTTLQVANEIEQAIWVNHHNYQNYQYANLISEFSIPLWLKMK
ncbi:NUDIX hydrolase [Myroides sp. LJL116]